MGFRSRKQPARLLFDQRIPLCFPGWAISLILVTASLFPNPFVRVGDTNGQCLARLRCFLSLQVNVVLAVTYSGIEERLTKIVLKRVRNKHGGLAVISTATGIVAVPLSDRPQSPRGSRSVPGAIPCDSRVAQTQADHGRPMPRSEEQK